MAQTLDRGGRLHRDVADDIVLEHAATRDVAFLRLVLAPSRDLDEHGKLALAVERGKVVAVDKIEA